MAEDNVITLEPEIGSALNWGPNGKLNGGEDNPELRWPQSIGQFDQMRRTDGQVGSVLRALTLPIRRTGWSLTGSDVNERVKAFVEAELGLQKDQTGRYRRPFSGVSWDEFLRMALTYLPMGHAVFERVYFVDTDGTDELTGLPIQVRLGKLSFRPHRTLEEWDVADDGSLNWVKQRILHTQSGNLARFESVPIPADRLVVFVCDREGGDWIGQSILRACWANWKIKTQLMRVDAASIERNGMGIPRVRYPIGESKSEALAIGKRIRAGEQSAVALSDGWDVDLIGVTGQTKEALPSIKYHNEEIGRSLLAMVLNLGHDNGARSLGDTFADIFATAQNAICAYVEEVVTEGIIRDLVRVNFGTDEPYPALKADEISADSALSPADLKDLADAGIIVPDAPLEEDIRRRYGLPDPDENSRREGAEPQTPIELDPLVNQPTPLAASRAVGPDLDELRERARQLQALLAEREEALR